MRYFLTLILSLWAGLLSAQEWEDRQVFGQKDAPTLRILSSTDTALFAPIIESFLAQAPPTQIEYLVTGTADIDTRYRQKPSAFDLVISSAMDLQLRLANDGFALRLNDLSHPDWAQWRQSLFAFTTEPATIVINRAAFADQAVPTTRQELIKVLRAAPDKFRGKVGTYDVRQSGVGYLFATQDARASETFWRLTEVMGGLDTQLYCCSGAMIEDVAAGKILVAYNVLGSYAAARSEYTKTLEIVLPSDFPITMMRTAFVSKQTGQPALATAFMDHLITLQSSGQDIDHFPLPPLAQVDKLQMPSSIPLETALLTYLDVLKRRTFIREWENAIIQER